MTNATLNPPTAVDLMALAMYHRAQAELAANPAEQCEHNRIADIYEVLATMDLPMSALTEVAPS